VSQSPGSMAELLKLVEGTEFEHIARDENKLREAMYDVMKASDDPMTREIGEGLASGTMTPMTIASTSAYADYLDQNLQALRQFDGDGLVEQLNQMQAAAAREKAEVAERRNYDDSDDLWQGFGGTSR
jgi:hypothetical protein